MNKIYSKISNILHLVLSLGILFTLCLSIANAQGKRSPSGRVPVVDNSDPSEQKLDPLEILKDLSPGIGRPKYDPPKSQRDPFKAFVAPKGGPGPVILKNAPLIVRFRLNAYKLVGVMWVGDNPRAMIVDPKDNTYFLSIGDNIANQEGIITQILDTKIIVEEKLVIKKLFESVEKIVTSELKFKK